MWRIERWVPVPGRKHVGVWTGAGRAAADEEMIERTARVYARHGTVVRARRGSEEFRVTRTSKYHVRPA